MSSLVRNFLNDRALKEELVLDDLKIEAIDLLERTDNFVKEMVAENRNSVNGSVFFPIMYDMYERSYEYSCGSLSLLLLGQLQSCEASCRTAIEGAVNLHYVSLGDSLEKIIQYFKDHFAVERKQNENWMKSIEAASVDEIAKQHHRDLIAGKNQALDMYETVLHNHMSEQRIDINKYNAKWPSIFDRFRLINDEVGYRTIYTGLCSQSHNDPEDLLNRLLCRVLAHDGFTEAKRTEQYFFSLYMVLQAIKYHAMAGAMFLAKFEIKVDFLIDQFNAALKIIEKSENKKFALLNALSSK